MRTTFSNDNLVGSGGIKYRGSITVLAIFVLCRYKICSC